MGLLSDSGAAACRALSGGSPDGRAAATRSAGPLPQAAGTRRYAATMTAPANRVGPVLCAGHPLAGTEITVKSAR